MKNEFNKVTNWSFKKEDFDKGPLPFLVDAPGSNRSELEKLSGVKISSQLGAIFTATATYDGLKRLNDNDAVIRIEYSRPGGSI